MRSAMTVVRLKPDSNSVAFFTTCQFLLTGKYHHDYSATTLLLQKRKDKEITGSGDGWT